ncbi:Succinate-semialdehyde dehydrogenase [NADP(+)] [Saitozyma sp. JCM 24511]|nr:Succinate-semialdehyde dehydrogenase [NADP(+)] [Saitozyma sp. JCM 24511]
MLEAKHQAPIRLNDPTLWIDDSLVNDEWVALEQVPRFPVTNPATSEVIGTVSDMTVEHCREAIDRAHEAFKTFSKTTPQFRADLLQDFHQLVLANKEDLAKLVTLENGKSLTDSIAEVKYAASYLQWNSGEALRLYGRTIPSSLPGTRNWTQLEPVGVVAALCPWNFPIGMICRKVGPALAVGATVVIKVPAETPFSVLALIELARRAGVPPNVLQVVTTDTHLSAIGDELCTNKKIKKISFTGSTRVGKLLASKSSSTLKKLSMELGGNAPFIVFEDADLDAAVAGALASKFRGSGQTCVCANRLYVHESIHSVFAAKFAAAVDAMKVGNGLDEGTHLGPLIHEKAVAKCVEHVEDALKRGATVVTKQRPTPSRGAFFNPVVLADAPQDCLLTDEETFGPVAALIKFKTEDEVINLANDTDFGLAGYFFSRDAARIFRVADALETGMVGVNTGVISQAVIPFGGIKESGWGKEGGAEAILDFCKVKAVIVGGGK